MANSFDSNLFNKTGCQKKDALNAWKVEEIN